jgi:hypothetical protein
VWDKQPSSHQALTHTKSQEDGLPAGSTEPLLYIPPATDEEEGQQQQQPEPEPITAMVVSPAEGQRPAIVL